MAAEKKKTDSEGKSSIMLNSWERNFAFLSMRKTIAVCQVIVHITSPAFSFCVSSFTYANNNLWPEATVQVLNRPLQFCHKFSTREDLIWFPQKQTKMEHCLSVNQNFIPFSSGEIAAQILISLNPLPCIFLYAPPSLNLPLPWPQYCWYRTGCPWISWPPLQTAGPCPKNQNMSFFWLPLCTATKEKHCKLKCRHPKKPPGFIAPFLHCLHSVCSLQHSLI